MELKTLVEPMELEVAFSVLKELRPHLDYPEFRRLYQASRLADGYELVGAFEQDKCVGVMGFRVLHDFVHGTHLYIDDLVITESMRSKGVGAALLKHADKLGKAKECSLLRLSTGIENEGGKRFYEREGWALRSVTYKKKA